MSGVFLIAVGSLFLAHNLLRFVGVSPIRVGGQALVWFGAYWPLLLIAWGAYKVYQRITHPERAHVSAAEIVILAWVLVAGVAIRGAQHVMDEMAVHVAAEDFASVLGPDLLGPVHRSEETDSFELDGATALVVENGRGQVVVIGTDRLELEVKMTKQINSFSDSDAERAMSHVNLEFRAGAEARLQTSREREGRTVVTDLEIRAPRAIPVRVINRRGAVRLEDLDAPAEVTTSHGNVDVSNLSSGVEAQTSRATIRLERISGPVVARTGHGAVRAFAIDGDVSATTDHGSITVEDVTGIVRLETANGAVRASDIEGGIEIDSPYSEVSVERARGSVTIAASHRPIFVHDVEGAVNITSRFARVVARGVTGDVTIDNVNRPVSVVDVAGAVSVTGEKSSVEVDTVAGAVTIAGTHEDIRVSGFGSSLDIRASDANVDISAARIADAVRVETSRGDVSVSLPSDASANFSASTRDGELRSDFREIAPAPDDDLRRHRWEGTLGAGTHPLTIVTSYGDVIISLRRVEPK